MPAVGIALGRDPLQRELTPYEILGLGRDADAADVDRAFRDGLLRRKHVSKLTGAKVALERRVERGLIDLFLYQPDALRWLRPSPLFDPRVLDLPQRAATARDWEALFRAQFPDVRIAHSLAVLWYWWAIADSESGDPAREEHWRRALGYWGMVAAHDDFWWSTAALVDAPGELRDALLERLGGDLRKLPAPAKPGEPGDCIDLDLLLQHEHAAARELFATGANTRYGRVACGPLLLRHSGMLGAVRERIEETLAGQPDDASMLRLREMLSDFAQVRALLAARKPADALAALARLHDGENPSAELVELRARAWLELGREQASLQRLDEALASWSQGVRSGAGAGEALRELRSELVVASRARAAALARRPEDAIAILERALELVDEDSLRGALAELIGRRGAGIALAAQQRLEVDRGVARWVLEELARALVDIERAERLGSDRAQEDLSFVRDLIAQATAVPDAVEMLKEVIQSIGGGVPVPALLRERLALLLCNRSVEMAGRAVQLAASVPAKQTRARGRALAQMRARRDQKGARGVRCNLCGATGGGQFSTLELADEPRFTLCHGCAKNARALGLRARSEEPLPLLTCAELELSEALQLDPASAVIQKNLGDVKQLRRTLQADPTAASEGTSPRTYIDLLFLLGFLLLLVFFFFRNI